MPTRWGKKLLRPEGEVHIQILPCAAWGALFLRRARPGCSEICGFVNR